MSNFNLNLPDLHFTFTFFTFMHLADAFIQSDLQCNQAIHLYFINMRVPWELKIVIW